MEPVPVCDMDKNYYCPSSQEASRLQTKRPYKASYMLIVTYAQNIFGNFASPNDLTIIAAEDMYCMALYAPQDIKSKVFRIC